MNAKQAESPTPTPLQAALANQKLRLAGDAAGVTPRELAAVINCLPPGRYRMANVVDRRVPSAEHLTDKGTDALLARAAAVPDEAAMSETAKSYLYWSDPVLVQNRLRLLGVGYHLLAKPTFAVMLAASVLMERGELRVTIEGDSLRIQRIKEREGTRQRPCECGRDHCGGCGHLEVEPFDEATGPMVPVASTTCLFCGAPTLGRDECGDCERSRHNDDAAQAAAQAREDAEGGVS
jgi:hypothetical protein